MYGALSAALPLALAAAVSPGLLAIVLLILATENRPRARAWFYLAGVLTVALVVTLIGWTTVRAVVDELERMPVGLSVALRFSVGLALAALGWRYLRPSDDPSVLRRPGWEERLRAARPPTYLVVGAATMLTNWSSLLLYLSALEVVKAAEAGLTATVLASIAVLIIMLSPLVLPVVAVTVVGHRADPFLARLRRSVDRHSRQMIASIYFLLAVLVAGSAFTVAPRQGVLPVPVPRVATRPESQVEAPGNLGIESTRRGELSRQALIWAEFAHEDQDREEAVRCTLADGGAGSSRPPCVT